MKAHIIWDWNGTLLNDFHVSLSATNQALIGIGCLPLTSDEYRSNYSVPVHDFYYNVLGRTPTRKEWSKIGQIFNNIYKPEVLNALLADEGMELLKSRKHQSICSLMEHNLLIRMLKNLKISHLFLDVHGRIDPLSKEGKHKHLEQHVHNLLNKHSVTREEIVVIGDTEDDANSAYSLGIPAILYSGGTYSYERLVNTGNPVAKTLKEAVHLADNIIKERDLCLKLL